MIFFSLITIAKPIVRQPKANRNDAQTGHSRKGLEIKVEAVYLLLIAIAMLACTGILAVDLKTIKRTLEAIQEKLNQNRDGRP